MNDSRVQAGPIPLMIGENGVTRFDIDQQQQNDQNHPQNNHDDDEESYLYSDAGTTLSPHLYSHSASLISKQSNSTKSTVGPSSSEDKNSGGQRSLSQSETSKNKYELTLLGEGALDV